MSKTGTSRTKKRTPKRKPVAVRVALERAGSALVDVRLLPDGFYFFRDPDYPTRWGIIDRILGQTWRIGERRAMRDDEWKDGVAFYRIEPPNNPVRDGASRSL